MGTVSSMKAAMMSYRTRPSVLQVCYDTLGLLFLPSAMQMEHTRSTDEIASAARSSQTSGLKLLDYRMKHSKVSYFYALLA